MIIPCFRQPLRSCTALLLKTASHTALSDDIDITTFYKKKERESSNSSAYCSESVAFSFYSSHLWCYVIDHEKSLQQHIIPELWNLFLTDDKPPELVDIPRTE